MKCASQAYRGESLSLALEPRNHNLDAMCFWKAARLLQSKICSQLSGAAPILFYGIIQWRHRDGWSPLTPEKDTVAKELGSRSTQKLLWDSLLHGTRGKVFRRFLLLTTTTTNGTARRGAQGESTCGEKIHYPSR